MLFQKSFRNFCISLLASSGVLGMSVPRTAGDKTVSHDPQASKSEAHFSEPNGLSEAAAKVYSQMKTLPHVKVAAEKQKIPHVLICTDPGKDPDDVTAAMVYLELEALGFMKIVGVIANFKPQDRRAKMIRGILDYYGRSEIPVGIGTEATTSDKPVREYEFDNTEGFKPNGKGALVEGQKLIRQVSEQAKKEGEKLTVLSLAGLMDFGKFVSNHEDAALFKSVIERMVLQSRYTIKNGVIEPRPDTTNNKLDFPTANEFYAFINQNKIPITVYTAVAADNSPLKPGFYETTYSQVKQPVLGWVETTRSRFEWQMYQDSVDPKTRFRPQLDPFWAVSTRTDYFESEKGYTADLAKLMRDGKMKDPGIDKSKIPSIKDEVEKEKVIQVWMKGCNNKKSWFNKSVVSDAIAALGLIGDANMKTIVDVRVDSDKIWNAVGTTETGENLSKNEFNFNGHEIANVVQALIEGSARRSFALHHS